MEAKKKFYYIAAEVERYLLSLRVEKLWTIDRRDGTHQMLSESLFIAPRNFFCYRATLPLLMSICRAANRGFPFVQSV